MTKSQKFFVSQILAVSCLLFFVPSAFGEISNIQVSNLTSSSATISWTTADTMTDGCIHYGLTTSLGDMACDPRPIDDVHFVEMSGLSTDTTYYFEVASGGEVDNNGGSYYTFRTTKVGIGIPYTIYSWVYLPGDTIADEGAIISVVVKSLASGGSSYPLATLSDSEGMWILNLGNLKDPSTNDVFSYSVDDTIFITAQGGADGEAYSTSIISGVSPQDVYCPPVKSDQQVPKGSLLLPNYPNPFNPTTAISYQLSAISYQRSAVSLKIYNITGQLVRTLVDEEQKAGYYKVYWDGKNDLGKGVGSGIYLYQLQANGRKKIRKMVLIR